MRERKLTGESQTREGKATKQQKRRAKEIEEERSRAHTRGWGLGGLNVIFIILLDHTTTSTKT